MTSLVCFTSSGTGCGKSCETEGNTSTSCKGATEGQDKINMG